MYTQYYADLNIFLVKTYNKMLQIVLCSDNRVHKYLFLFKGFFGYKVHWQLGNSQYATLKKVY